MSWHDVDEVRRSLEVAASEAPASPRAAVIRASLLDAVDRPSRRAFTPAILAMAAVVLIAVVARVGTPVVGSFLEAASVEPAPAIGGRSDEPSKALGGLDAKDAPTASASASPESSPDGVPSSAPVVVVPIGSPTPSPSVAPTPTPGPGHVPIVLPTPPVPIPIPTLPAP